MDQSRMAIRPMVVAVRVVMAATYSIGPKSEIHFWEPFEAYALSWRIVLAENRGHFST